MNEHKDLIDNTLRLKAIDRLFSEISHYNTIYDFNYWWRIEPAYGYEFYLTNRVISACFDITNTDSILKAVSFVKQRETDLDEQRKRTGE